MKNAPSIHNTANIEQEYSLLTNRHLTNKMAMKAPERKCSQNKYLDLKARTF